MKVVIRQNLLRIMCFGPFALEALQREKLSEIGKDDLKIIIIHSSPNIYTNTFLNREIELLFGYDLAWLGSKIHRRINIPSSFKGHNSLATTIRSG